MQSRVGRVLRIPMRTLCVTVFFPDAACIAHHVEQLHMWMAATHFFNPRCCLQKQSKRGRYAKSKATKHKRKILGSDEVNEPKSRQDKKRCLSSPSH